MVPNITPTRLLELLRSHGHPESVITVCSLTILFILASAFDVSFRIVSTTILIFTLPATRLIASAAFCASRSILFSIYSAVYNLWFALTSSSPSQAVARRLADATPVLGLLILTLLASWNALSSFYGYDVPDATGPSSPGPPKGRSTLSRRRPQGLPVLKLPCDATPTPRGERERRYLEIISSLDAKVTRRAKGLEKLRIQLDQAKQAIGARDASIADRDRTIAKNAEVIVEKDATIARLTEDVQHLRSDNAGVLSMLTRKAAHISAMDLELEAARGAEERCQAVVGALRARIEVLEADLGTARAEVVQLRSAAPEQTILPPGGATALQEEECSARQTTAVALKDELIASLQVDVLKLQRELDSAHCRVIEKDALLAIQASAVDDLQSERDATARSSQAQTQLIKELNDKLAAYEQEATDRWLSEHHLPPDDLETCDVGTGTDVLSLTQQLAAAKQEALDATRLQRAYEEVADAGAVRVIELVEKLEEQKELSEVDRELFLARIGKLTAMLEKAQLGIPVPDKAFAQLRLPTSTSSARAEDSFTAVTPRLPASSEPASPSASPRSARKLRRRSAIENLRQPLVDVTASVTANFPLSARQSVRRSRLLRRPSSILIPNGQSPLQLSLTVPS